MARDRFGVQVLTPEGEVWRGEVEMLSTQTTTGSIGVLANHAPLQAILEPAELRLWEEGSEALDHEKAIRFAQSEGYLQVAENDALVLVEEAMPPDSLDRADLEAKLAEARATRDKAAADIREIDARWTPRALAPPERQDETETYRRADANVRRYETFLNLTSPE